MGTVEAGPGGITDQQASFIDHYLTDCNLNAVKAAIAAGYKDGPGIHVQAHRLAHNPKIQEEINRRLEERHMTANELLDLIARDAKGTFGEYVNPDSDGDLDLHAMAEDGLLGLIEQVVPTKYGTSYKGPSRQRAQEMLIKIMGLNKVHHEVSGPGGGPVEIKLSSEEQALRLQALLTLQQATDREGQEATRQED